MKQQMTTDKTTKEDEKHAHERMHACKNKKRPRPLFFPPFLLEPSSFQYTNHEGETVYSKGLMIMMTLGYVGKWVILSVDCFCCRLLVKEDFLSRRL